MTPPPIKDIGHETLERISGALSRYNDWMYEQIAPHIGQDVLEIGSGIGNLSMYLVGRKRVCLSDVSETYLDILRERFGAKPGIQIHRWDLSQPSPEAMEPRTFDTIICLNVLEHIREDGIALERMRRLLKPGGRLLLLVPAHPFLYNGFDKALEHFRRYDVKGLRARLSAAGFSGQRLWYFNAAGTFGWFINGTLLRKTLLPTGQMKLFDRLVPLLKLERLVGPPFGISLIAISTVGTNDSNA